MLSQQCARKGGTACGMGRQARHMTCCQHPARTSATAPTHPPRPPKDDFNICQSPELSCGSLYHVWTSEGDRAPPHAPSTPAPPPSDPPAPRPARRPSPPTGVLESAVRMHHTVRLCSGRLYPREKALRRALHRALLLCS